MFSLARRFQDIPKERKPAQKSPKPAISKPMKSKKVLKKVKIAFKQKPGDVKVVGIAEASARAASAALVAISAIGDDRKESNETQPSSTVPQMDMKHIERKFFLTSVLPPYDFGELRYLSEFWEACK